MAVYNRLIRAAAFTVIDLTKPFTLGLTGQSGAGKSYICKKLKERGFNIIDCDEVVKIFMIPTEPWLNLFAPNLAI